MYVASFLELHTTLLGWMLFNVVFNILWDTGLLILPILWMLVRNSARSIGEEREGSHETAVLHIKGTVMAIAVLLTCLMPVYEVAPSDVRFQPPKNADGTVPDEVRGDIDPSTYGDYFGSATAPVKIPGWWVLLHQVSSGITHALVNSLPPYSDLREARMLMASRNIEDPALGAEYRDFYLGCYLPAKRNYEVLAPQNLVPVAGDDAQLDWPGSPYLIGMRGGYLGCGGDPRYCRNAPMPLDIQKSTSLASRVGGTTCEHWWESMRTRLLDYARKDQGSFDKLVNSIQLGLGVEDRREQEDLLVRGMLENFQAGQAIAGSTGSGNLLTWAGDAIGSASLAVGWGVAELFLNIMKQVMPILAAMMLMLVTVFIPLALLFGGYRIETVLNISFLVFSLIFVQGILAVVAWFDNYLITSLFENEGAWSFMSRQDNLFADANKKMLINFILATLYMIGPIIWLAIMSSIGIKAAGAAQGLFHTTAITNAMQAGAQSVQRTAIGGASGAAAGGVKRGIGAAESAGQRYRLWNDR